MDRNTVIATVLIALIFVVWIFFQPPGPPRYAMPATGTENVSGTPTLAWEAVSGASGYELQWSTNNLFSPQTTTTREVADTFYVAQDLEEAAQYFWRVRAVNWGGSSPWFAGQFATVGYEGIAAADPSTNGADDDAAGIADGAAVPAGRQAAPAVPSNDSTFAAATVGEERVITVQTDLYEAKLSTKGATLVSFTFNEYTMADGETPVQLVDTTKHGALGLFFTSPSSHNIDTRAFYFEPNISGDRLVATSAPQTISFVANLGDGRIRQTYTFTPGTYEVGLAIEQDNAISFATREGYELFWDGAVPFSEARHEDEVQRSGAYARSGGEVESVTVMSDAYEEKTLSGDVDWMAVKNKYFTAVVIPDREPRGAELIAERIGEADVQDVLLDFQTRLQMPPAADAADTFRLYLGPMEYYQLADYDLGLYGMVDYGWDFFEMITRPLAKFVFIPAFTYLGRILPNYGLVIIVLAMLVKLLVYPLTKKSYESMARMRELQPKMEAIKEKHGDNPQKQQEAMMKMYKETGVNPLGGCLPMLLQYPIIIALWMFLPQSIEIRQQGFLWAHDLSAPDIILNLPFTIPLYGNYVAGFTLLMGLSMVVQMKIQMASQPSNPQTKIFTYVFPVMIFAIFNKFASGLSLYYLCFNILTAIQQKFINKSIEAKKEASNGKGDKKDAGKVRKVSKNGKATPRKQGGGKKGGGKRVGTR